MSRQDRLKEYAEMRGPSGAARDQKVIDYWSDRASANSKIAPRASAGPMKLPSTGKRINVRDTGSKPFEARKIDRLMAGKEPGDLNHVGNDTDYMPNVRRRV